jgi:hypothetical protein
MITLIVLGTAATIVVVLFAAMLARHTPRRENRLAYSKTLGAAPWIDAGSSNCDATTSGDAGCGDVSGSDAGCGDGGGGAGN